jgi:periplasmic divalent cation tolerance protein
MSYVQIVTTAPSREEADRIARTLVQRRLAACAQISGPIDSTYRWQGAIESSREWVCAAKTRRERFDDVARAIRECHSYTVPEILAFPIAEGSADYLAWIDAQVEQDGARD